MNNTNENQQNQEELILDDYKFVLFHAMWHKKSTSNRELIFGMIEAFPKEIDIDSFTFQEDGQDFKKCGRIYYIREKMCVSEAISLYKQVLQEKRIPMLWENREKIIYAQNLDKFMEWPMFFLANHNKLPFVAENWDIARVHSLYPQKVSNELYSIVNREHIADWINNRLCFTFADGEAPLLGSFHLVLPNPIFRSIQQRLNTMSTPNLVRVTTIPRENIPTDCSYLSSFHITHIEEHPLGLRAESNFHLSNNFEIDIPIANSDSKSSILVFCKKRGLLYTNEPNNFLKSINVHLNIHQATVITSLTYENTNESLTHRVEKYTSTEFSVGDKKTCDEKEPGEILKKQQKASKLEEAAKKYGQTYIINEEMAREFIVKTIMGSVNKKLTIIDPYFTDYDLDCFAMMVKKSNVPITIITGNEILKGKSTIVGKTDKAIYENYHDFLQDPNKKDLITLKVKVMTGDMVFHDRFIVIDNETVWFSGNSFNNIGKRRSMILKLPDPRPVLSDLKKILEKRERIIDFEDWQNNFKREKAKNEND